MASLKGRKMLYPRDFGNTTIASSNAVAEGVGYHALRILGYCYGAFGIQPPLTTNPDDCLFTNVNIETSFGNTVKTLCRLPIMTGALGSTFIAEKYWDSFAVGAALCGYPDCHWGKCCRHRPEIEIKNGKISSAPELDRQDQDLSALS